MLIKILKVTNCTNNQNKNQLNRQTGSRNLTSPKRLPTIWYTYMMLVTKSQISAISSYWEKCDEKYIGWTKGQTNKGKTVYPPPPLGCGGIISFNTKITYTSINGSLITYTSGNRSLIIYTSGNRSIIYNLRK